MPRNISIQRALVALTLIGAGLVMAAPAQAAGGTQGELLLKGAGSVYGGPGAETIVSAKFGTAGSFAVGVRNTGSSTAQFVLRLSPACGQFPPYSCPTAPVLLSGTTNITAAALGPNGYTTAPIAPGATATYTLKLVDATTGPYAGVAVLYALTLSDTAGNQLGLTSLAVREDLTTRLTPGVDQFVSSTGSPSTQGDVTAESVAVGKTFTYSVRLVNQRPGPTKISYRIFPYFQDCSADFPLKVNQGSALGPNVTAAVLAGTYSTPNLGRGASTTLILTGTSGAGGAACLGSGDQVGWMGWIGFSRDAAGGGIQHLMTFNPAAT
jgi:hypothetical protein